ncbi:hypothetical protein EB151_07225 [archaeon]|nr:hypothetical protein [archaeon]
MKKDIRKKKEMMISSDTIVKTALLEALLAQSSKEKDELRIMVLNLTKEVAALSVKVEYLTKENEELHKKAGKTRKIING